MTAIAITGAAGEVGREAVRALDDHRLALFTHHATDALDSEVLDVTDRAAFVAALDGQDVLVHLAWGPGDETDWTDGHEANVRGVYHAYEAARANDLDRVVFASSAHVAGMYNRDDPAEMESTAATATETVRPTDPVRPDSYYGVAKAACEAMGRYYADRFGLDVVDLRIGWLMARDELRDLRETHDAPARLRFARAMWLSPRDCRAVLRAAALAPLSRTPLTLHAISRNSDRYLSLTETMRHLGYRPRDDAADLLDD